MKARFLALLTTLAFLGLSISVPAFAGKDKGCGTTNPHPSCGDGGGGNTDEVPVYRAQLLKDGYFDFVQDGLTSARKGKSLRGNGTLSVAHNPVEGNPVEVDIFRRHCGVMLTGVGITAFEVLESNWSISHTRSRGGPDQIHITMNNLMIDLQAAVSEGYSQTDFDLHLHGEIAEDFLPESGDVDVAHTLTRYMLWAGGRGEEGWFVCNSTGNGMETWELLPQPITLTITRTSD